MSIKLPKNFSFNHVNFPGDERTVRWDNKSETYLEEGGKWTLKQAEGFVNGDNPLWINVKPVLPEGKFAFNHRDGDLYFGEVKGDKLHVTWLNKPGGVEGCEYALDGGWSSAYDNFMSGTWVLNDFANGFKVSGTPAEAVHERLRTIARGMSYGEDLSEAAAKHLLFELADKLEHGTAHQPAPLNRLLLAAVEHSYDVTFLTNGKIMLSGVRSGSRCVDLGSIELANQWFDLKAQLDALESA
jgi:hypothetical protein